VQFLGTVRRIATERNNWDRTDLDQIHSGFDDHAVVPTTAHPAT